MFPSNPIVEVLNTQHDKKDLTNSRLLVFTPLTKEEHDKLSNKLIHYQTFPRLSTKRMELNEELKKLFDFTYADIIAIGDTVMEVRLANTYIESNKVHVNTIERNNYKCFVNHDWKELSIMNLPHHEDGGCSWNCLMQKLRMPEYGIIYTIANKDKRKFKIDE